MGEWISWVGLRVRSPLSVWLFANPYCRDGELYPRTPRRQGRSHGGVGIWV